jgi:hypothetical protein
LGGLFWSGFKQKSLLKYFFYFLLNKSFLPKLADSDDASTIGRPHSLRRGIKEAQYRSSVSATAASTGTAIQALVWKWQKYFASRPRPAALLCGFQKS